MAMASINLIKASDGTGSAAVAIVQTTRAAGATTINVSTVDNFPSTFMGTMGTPHTFVDPITAEEITVISDATARDFTGNVVSTHIEISSMAPNNVDIGSAAGDIIVIKPTTNWANNVATVLAESHNDNGTLKDNAVTTDKIADGNITGSKIADGNIIGSKIADNAVTTDKIADGNIIGSKIANGNVTGEKIANGAITANRLFNGTATAAVAALETSSSFAYTDLATAGPAATVTIGVNGLALVIIEAEVTGDTATGYVYMSFAVSGASTVAAGTYETHHQITNAAHVTTKNATFLVSGLTAGSNTFTAKYKVAITGFGTWTGRRISVIPL